MFRGGVGGIMCQENGGVTLQTGAEAARCRWDFSRFQTLPQIVSRQTLVQLYL